MARRLSPLSSLHTDLCSKNGESRRGRDGSTRRLRFHGPVFHGLIAFSTLVMFLFACNRSAWSQLADETIINTVNGIIAGAPEAGSTHTPTLNVPAHPHIVTTQGTMAGDGGGVLFNIQIYKAGIGTWRLDGAGQHNIAAGGSNTFNVNQGTLELMNGTTITQTGGAAPYETRFVTGANTTLNARGGNVITAAEIELGNWTEFGLDLTNYDTGAPAPVLKLDGNIINNPLDGTINLLGFKNQTLTDNVQLLEFSYTRPATEAGADPAFPPPPIRVYNPTDPDQNPNVLGPANAAYGQNFATFNPDTKVISIKVRGENWEDVVNASGRLQGIITQTFPEGNTGGTSQIIIRNFASTVGAVSWTGNGDRNWNATSANNWTGIGNTFLHGDTVTFGVAGSGTVFVQAGGVQIGKTVRDGNTTTYGMEITGGNYVFMNDQHANGNDSLIGIDGEGSVRVSGALNSPTTVAFMSANSYWGGTVIDGYGEVTLGHSAGLGTGTVNLNALGTLIFNTDTTAPVDDMFYNNIAGVGVGEIIKIGNNSVQIEGRVTTASNTTVKKGTLKKNIGTGLLTVYKDATYELTGINQTVSGLSNGPLLAFDELNGGKIDLNGGGGEQTLTMNVSGNYRFSGYITGSGKLIKAGSGTQAITHDPHHPDYPADGWNDYTGGTEIYAGVLIAERFLENAETEVAITPFGSGTVDIKTEGTLRFHIGHYNPPIVPANAGVFGNTIIGGGKVLKTGDATLSLTSANSTYTGSTTVQEGNLRVEHINATGKTEGVELSDGTNIQFKGVGGTGLGTPYDRIINGQGGMEVLEATTVHVRGTNGEQPGSVSSYTGATMVYEGGNLILLDATGTGKTSKVDLTVGADPDDPTVNPSILTLYFDGADTVLEYDRYITGAGNLAKNGTGTAILVVEEGTAKLNDYEGTTTVHNGTLKLTYAEATGKNDSADAHRVLIAQPGFLELAFDGEYAKSITGAGAIIKSEDGTVTTLKGYSTYTGGTYIDGGTLSFNDMDPATPGNLGTGGVYFRKEGGVLQNTGTVAELGQNVYLEDGATATFDTQADLTIGAIYSIGGTGDFIKTGPADMTINAGAAWTGSTTVKEGWLNNNIPDGTVLTVFGGAGYYTGQAHRTVSAIWGDSNTSGGTVRTETGFDFIVDYTDRDQPDIFAGRITGGGNLVLVGHGTIESTEVNGEIVQVNKPTTLILRAQNGANDYSGTTSILGNYGMIVGDIASGTDLYVNSTGTYRSDGKDRLIRALRGNGTVDMENRSLSISQNSLTDTPEFSGKLSNVYNLNKTGDGAQVFRGMTFTITNNVSVLGGSLVLGDDKASRTKMIVGNDLLVGPNVMDSDGLTILKTTALEVKGMANVEVRKNMTINGTLDMVVDGNLITAESVNLGDRSVLNVTGIGEGDDYTVIIRSKTEIEDDFWKVTVAGTQPTVDYLVLDVMKSDDKKEILVGQMLRWYATEDAHGTFTLTDLNGSYTVRRSLVDITDEYKRDPDWDGKTLTKRGQGKLILAMENTYTGKTLVEGGTLALLHEKATGGSVGVELNGGTLELNFDSRDRDGKWTAGMNTPISGSGGVVKTGRDTISILSGANTYTGTTRVSEGALLVDGSGRSKVVVSKYAGFGGNGTINNAVVFEDDSYFLWRFGATQGDSDMLKVNDDVLVGQNVAFRPMTNDIQGELPENISGWKVLQYGGNLTGRFVVDSSTNPFYDFSLDYDEKGYVKIGGIRRETPLALSDISSTALMMAQTKMYRSAYQQIAREWSCDCPVPNVQQISNPDARGQAPGTYRTAWANFVGRGDHFESSFFDDDFSFQSYGVQAGVSLLSSCDHTLGMMFGREEGKLSNNSDKMEDEEYYLGFYYGRLLRNNFDFKTYIGGGWQKFDMNRFSNDRHYKARFSGNTFNYNFEFGRRFLSPEGFVIRPFFGFDIEIVRMGGAKESTNEALYSNEIRNYRGSDFNQVFFKVGIDASKNWKWFDLHTGVNFNWNLADTRPETTIYYPHVDRSVVGRAVDMGRFNVGLNVGLNWYITERRNSMFYIDYVAEIHQDRKNDFASGTGNVGFFWRF